MHLFILLIKLLKTTKGIDLWGKIKATFIHIELCIPWNIQELMPCREQNT